MAGEQVWAVATCFQEVELISTFVEFVVALSYMDYLRLIDD